MSLAEDTLSAVRLGLSSILEKTEEKKKTKKVCGMEPLTITVDTWASSQLVARVLATMAFFILFKPIILDNSN